MERPLTIAIYGTVNAGKSSIVNALMGRAVAVSSARGGETVIANAHRLAVSRHCAERVELLIVDTPGIAEVNGDVNVQRALAATTSADLVLFVLPADITEGEMQALIALRDRGKPVIVALNKMDQLRYAREDADACGPAWTSRSRYWVGEFGAHLCRTSPS